MPAQAKTACSPWRRCLPLLLLLSLPPGLCATEAISIFLKSSNQVPPVSSWARGRGQITVLPDRRISGTIKTSGFLPTQAHLHEGDAGKNGPTILLFDRTLGDDFHIPAGSRLTETQYESYLEGKLYVNVHSALHPNGEIRGQLLLPEIVGTGTRPGY